MNDAYLQLTIEELAMNEEFIQWARDNKNHDASMQNWLVNNPTQNSKINEAKQIVNQLIYKTIDWDNQRKDNLWKKIDQSTSALSSTTGYSSTDSSRPMWRGLAVAATIFVAALMIWMWPSNSNIININTNLAQNIERTLPDNSTIWINENSTIEYDSASFVLGKRIVQLKGEAQFQVSKNKGRFEVVTSKGSIVVLGTRFNVIDKDGLFRVSCYEGKVKVNYKERQVILTAGKSISWNEQNGEMDSTNVIVDGMASWINNKQYFTAQPLSIIFDELEKKFGIVIEFETNTGNRLYTGFTDKNSLENSLKSVCWPLHLKYKIEKNKVIISEE